MYRRLGPVLLVVYGIHRDHPTVFVSEIVLTPHSDLADAEHDPPLM